MQALSEGTKAPDVTLTTTKGKPFILSEALKRGPVVLAFFKVSCPTCQYAFPYLERLYKGHITEPLTIVGVSQDDARATEAFIKEYGITFPVVLEDTQRYGVSNAYGLTNVPSIFLISGDGEVERTIVGWSRADMEDLNSRLAMMSPDHSVMPIFRPGEQVVEFKAG